MGFKGSSFLSLGNRMFDGNASEPALHRMCSRMPEWDLKEVQNRVKENLALTEMILGGSSEFGECQFQCLKHA